MLLLLDFHWKLVYQRSLHKYSNTWHFTIVIVALGRRGMMVSHEPFYGQNRYNYAGGYPLKKEQTAQRIIKFLPISF
jgi:hypothetical protein